MIIRQGLNVTAHLLAGMAFGALAVVAAAACCRARRRDHDEVAERQPPAPEPADA